MLSLRIPRGEPEPVTKQSDLVKGTLDMLILKTLAMEAMHGYGIALRIEQISGGVFQVNPGSLLPALSRLHREGLIDSDWRTSENNRRAKYYAINSRGIQKLRSEKKAWQVQTQAIADILKA